MEQLPQGPVVGLRKTKEPEQIVLVARKHLFGLFVLYFQAMVGVVAALALIVFLVPSVFKDNKTMAYGIGSVAVLVILVIVALVLIVATIVYRKSQLVVTTKNLTQVNQIGLFNRKISQLGLEDIEDVSAEKKGVFASIFNFGTVYVETAGEQANFHFDFCPNPDKIAHQISIVEQQAGHGEDGSE